MPSTDPVFRLRLRRYGALGMPEDSASGSFTLAGIQSVLWETLHTLGPGDRVEVQVVHEPHGNGCER